MALLLGDIVRRQARHRPDRIAYVIGARRVSYRGLNALANRLAHSLRAHGVTHGDRVATLAPNRFEYPAIYFAVAKLGAIHVPVNFRYRAGEVRYVLSQSEASVLLYADEYAGIVEEVRGDLPALRRAPSSPTAPTCCRPHRRRRPPGSARTTSGSACSPCSTWAAGPCRSA